MGINLNPFTWWNGASWGTILGLRGKRQVGEDSLGNTYWEGGRDTAGNPRRWVIYSGANDASRVPPEWFSWLSYQIDDVPDRALPPEPDAPPAAGQRLWMITLRTPPRWWWGPRLMMTFLVTPRGLM